MKLPDKKPAHLEDQLNIILVELSKDDVELAFLPRDVRRKLASCLSENDTFENLWEAVKDNSSTRSRQIRNLKAVLAAQIQKSLGS